MRSMSIKGHPNAWLRASLERGDLPGVRSAAAELPQVNLADALAIVVLMAADEDPAYERAATRYPVGTRGVLDEAGFRRGGRGGPVGTELSGMASFDDADGGRRGDLRRRRAG
jgi:hypothetical protein